MFRILQWEPFDERERARVGDQAEMYARQIISRYGEGVLLRGPLVPSIDSYGRIDGYRESDFLVYTQGTVFCVEVKHYAGTITYLPRYAPRQMGYSYGFRNQRVIASYDTSKLLQIKQGRRGETVEKTYLNPLKKTRSFILLLKKYVGRIEPRFQRLYIIPVVCFSHQADIRAIYNFQEGMIQIEQLPDFFLQHRNERFAAQPSPWIAETILNKIPNWDRVLTTNGEWINGILVEPYLTFRGVDGRLYSLSHYNVIKAIKWQQTYRAAYTEMVVTYTNGASQTHYCSGGQLSLIRGERPETFNLQNLQQLVIGLANKLVL
ncbi:nuclease-related domain-containing protein [Ktedonosporobacter rubrisoli]|nr:nuclease-related domain-containing protein [Ktedonosporobacter rubrisoli]